MPRRSAGAAGRGGLKPTVFSLLFLIPIVAAAQQQQPHRNNNHHDAPQVYQGSPQEESLFDTYTPNSRNGHSSTSVLSDAPLKPTHQRRENELINPSDDARALATVAPANAAVRAPRPATRSAAGLHQSQLQPRSLRNWEVEDFVLLATIDGTLYARNRGTGDRRWEVQAERPMVHTTYHRKEGDVGNGDLEEDLYWIVEPSQDGSLYVYTPGPNGGMRKLGLTVKYLAEEFSGYRSEDPPVVYIARKESSLFTIDAETGKFLQVFSSSGSTSFEGYNSCKRASGLPHVDDDECKPNATFTLGRIEYTVAIQNGDTGEPICTIQYFEWAANNRDRDLHSQHFTSMDNKYVYSRHDGNVLFLESPDDRENSQVLYQTKFDSPVVRVFDVIRPYNPDVRESSLVLLPQPIGPAVTDSYPDDIFVDCTKNGSLYAMSEMQYPSVTNGAPKAKCYSKEFEQKSLGWDGEPTAPERDALVGLHSLAERDSESTRIPVVVPRGPGLLDPVAPGRIGGGEPGPSAPHVPEKRREDPIEVQAPNESSWLSISSFKTFLILILLGACGFIYVDPKLRKTADPLLNNVSPEEIRAEVLPETQPMVTRPSTPAAGSPAEESEKADKPEDRRVRFDVAEPGRSRDPSLARTETLEDDDKEATGEDGQTPGDGTSQDTPKKKKAHRGARGGRSARSKKRRAQQEKEAQDAIESITHVPNEAPTEMGPDSPTLITDGITGVASDPIQ
jgi:serine/threonine-protein kinase/endoribonuclease IRE1